MGSGMAIVFGTYYIIIFSTICVTILCSLGTLISTSPTTPIRYPKTTREGDGNRTQSPWQYAPSKHPHIAPSQRCSDDLPSLARPIQLPCQVELQLIRHESFYLASKYSKFSLHLLSNGISRYVQQDYGSGFNPIGTIPDQVPKNSLGFACELLLSGEDCFCFVFWWDHCLFWIWLTRDISPRASRASQNKC